MSKKYHIGTKIKFKVHPNIDADPIFGTIIKNFKLPNDICIKWDTDQIASYDEHWLNDNVTIEKAQPSTDERSES